MTQSYNIIILILTLVFLLIIFGFIIVYLQNYKVNTNEQEIPDQYPNQTENKTNIPIDGSSWWEAESGSIFHPLVKKDNYVYRNSNDNRTGLADYSISIPESGNYLIWMKLSSSQYINEGLFINIDDKPINEVRCNIPKTRNKAGEVIFKELPLYCMSSTEEKSVFYLKPGTHKFKFSINNSEIKIDQIKLEQVFSEPVFAFSCNKENYLYVYVLSENNKTTKIFCDNEDVNSIQQAINYAQNNSLRKVKLDPGIFTIKDKVLVAVRIRPPETTFDKVTAGIYVPSDIHLFGSSDSTDPTIIQMSEDFKNYWENEIKVLMYLSGSPIDSHIPVENTVIENIEIAGKTNGVCKVIEGLKTNDARNISIKNVHVHDTQMSGIVLGGFSPYEQDSSTGLARIYIITGTPSNYAQVTDNYVHNVGGDAISVTGQFVLIANNKIDAATTEGMSNGIGIFASTSYITIENNTIGNSFTGIGSDGSYPYYRSYSNDEVTVPDIDDSGKGNEIGFNTNLLIRNNTLKNNKKGIVLWRGKGITIANNIISGNSSNIGTGISLNEAKNSNVAGNVISKVDRGINLISYGYSLSGTVRNIIGANDNNSNGNNITRVNYGILFSGSDPELIKNNIVKGNSITNFHKKACDFTKGSQTIALGNSPSVCNNN